MSLIAQFQDARQSSKDLDDAFGDFFRALGYTVGLEGRRQPFELWHEIYDDGTLVCQVKTGTPLAEFLTDLPYLVEHKSGIGPTDYWAAFKNDKQSRAMLARVSAHSKGNS